MDVVALAQHGFPFTVATLGTATTLEHLERLFRITNDVTFCFDGDAAGRNAAWRALETVLSLLREGRRAHFLFLPEGEDPDSLVRKEGRQAFGQRLEQALSLSDYIFEHLGANVGMRSLDERARMAEQACALFDKMPDSVYRDMLMQRLADITELGKVDIESRLTAPIPAVVSLARRINPTRTPVRLAIAHLLNCTRLAHSAGNPERFQHIDLPGLPLLKELIELLQSHPHIEHAGQLLARYEGTEEGRVLKRLAEWQPPYPSEFCEKEFLDTLVQLESSLQKNLLDKFVRGKLKPEEKEMLRGLSKTPPKHLLTE
jgi:DNA primase